MKSIARKYMLWFESDKYIENLAKSCIPCLENKLQPAAAPLHLWIWPTTQQKKIQIDLQVPLISG